MTVERSENTEMNEVAAKIQPYIFRFVVAFGVLMLIVPLLPGFVSNLIYAFSGDKPKIYWYLSRAAGFVSLSILWVAMAMGLTITNKLARKWPGTPAAFAVHQYVSLLGLAFAVYHGLVLMGDHFVDFSLPRLATPFSIDYARFWVGLGQLGFYVWCIVVLSFYVRKHIGQKVWRLIHYANFAMYLMGLLHGIFSGTESNIGWAQWYYWVSALSLLALVGYRVYQARSEKESARAKAARRNATPAPQAPVPAAPSRPESSPVARTPEQIAAPAATAENEITKPSSATPAAPQPEEVTAPENVPQPVVPEEKEPAPPAAQVDVKKQPAVISPQPKIQKRSPLEQAASILRIQKLFDEIRPPKPLPEKPVQMPVLRIRLEDFLSEESQAEAPWNKVTLDEMRVQPMAEPKQIPPSRLLLRRKENPPHPSASTLRIRPRRAVVEEDKGNV